MDLLGRGGTECQQAQEREKSNDAPEFDAFLRLLPGLRSVRPLKPTGLSVRYTLRVPYECQLLCSTCPMGERKRWSWRSASTLRLASP
jgi:hypothetical protein